MIATSPMELLLTDYFLKINITNDVCANVKLEGLSATGSIKIKPAISMISHLEEKGTLKPGMDIIESSSGNLGIALAMICATKGYNFTCVSDPNISPQTARIIKAYGARLIIVKDKDLNGGYLSTRIALIRSLIQSEPNLTWINQYENIANINAHYSMTGPEILREFPDLDYIFIGAGTTGTLGGVSIYLKEHSPKTKIIAVDSVGSVTFNTPSGKRFIPGLGSSCSPPLSQHSVYDELILIPETETIKMCNLLAKKGILLGGSSGTVLSAVHKFADNIPKGATVVAISPDMGDRYVDTIYNQEWVSSKFPVLNNKADLILEM